MKKTSMLFIVALAGIGFFTGCGEKKEPIKAAAPIEAKPIEQAQPPVPVAVPAPTQVPSPAPLPEPPKPSTAPQPAPSADTSAKGAEIFKSKCMACHGQGGKGSPMAPAFIGNAWVKSASKAEIAGVIKNGRQGAAKAYKAFPMGMPAYMTLSDDERSALADYIKAASKN
jgi:mono/diheme cytochrome c family protein